MKLTNIFGTEEDRAVSPVIGVILMVAITVILAAVIGAFVIGIGGEQDNAPTASIDFDQETDTLTVQHQSGATLDAGEITFSGDVHSDFDDDDFEDEITEIGDVSGLWAGDDDEISAGERITFADSENAPDNVEGEPWPVLDGNEGTINVVWESSDTDSSSIIADFDFDIDSLEEDDFDDGS